MEKLIWHTEKMKWEDMIPYEKNARKIKAANRKKLDESLEEFDVVEIPIIDFDNIIIGGHQRRHRMVLHGKGAQVVDVRKPNRKLTDHEFKKLNLLLNSEKFKGEYDLKMLEEFFSEFDLKEEFDIDMPSFKDLDLPENMPEESEPEMTIVPKFSEKYSAVVIVIENEIDENFVRSVLGLAKAKDYKTDNVGESYVLTAKQFTEAWNKK